MARRINKSLLLVRARHALLLKFPELQGELEGITNINTLDRIERDHKQKLSTNQVHTPASPSPADTKVRKPVDEIPYDARALRALEESDRPAARELNKEWVKENQVETAIGKRQREAAELRAKTKARSEKQRLKREAAQAAKDTRRIAREADIAKMNEGAPYTDQRVKEASEYFKGREGDPLNFYDDVEKEHYQVLRENHKYVSYQKARVKSGEIDPTTKIPSDPYAPTRWNKTDDAWKNFDTSRASYNKAVKRAAISAGHIENSAGYEKFLDEWGIDSGHGMGKRVSPHNRDASGNIIAQNRGKNRDKKATMSFADLVDNMDISKNKGPRIGVDEVGQIKRFMEQYPDSLDPGTSRVEGTQKQVQYLLNLERTNDISRKHPAASALLFDQWGDPRSYEDMKSTGDVSSPREYHSVRNLVLTMMDQNPEFDLPFYMSQMKIPEEFRMGMPNLEDGTPQKHWETSVTENRTSPDSGFRFNDKEVVKKQWQKILKSGRFPKGVGGTAALVALLAASGVANARELVTGVEAGGDPGYLTNLLDNMDFSYDMTSGTWNSTVRGLADQAGLGGVKTWVDNAEQGAVDWINEATGPKHPGAAPLPFGTGDALQWGVRAAGDWVTELPGLAISGVNALGNIQNPGISTQQGVAPPMREQYNFGQTPQVNAYLQEQRRQDMAPFAGLLKDRFFTNE